MLIYWLVNVTDRDVVRFCFTGNVVPLVFVDGVKKDARMRHTSDFAIAVVVIVVVVVLVDPVGETDLGSRFPGELLVAVHVGKSDPCVLKYSNVLLYCKQKPFVLDRNSLNRIK
jgi:hypothetical protein